MPRSGLAMNVDVLLLAIVLSSAAPESLGGAVAPTATTLVVGGDSTVRASIGSLKMHPRWHRSIRLGRWVYAGESDHDVVLIQPLSRSDGYWRMWTRIEYRAPIDGGFGNYLSLDALTEFDCLNLRLRLVRSTQYSARNLKGTVEHTEASSATTWGDDPRGLGRDELTFVCTDPRAHRIGIGKHWGRLDRAVRSRAATLPK
jgi:hypothetical protein